MSSLDGDAGPHQTSTSVSPNDVMFQLVGVTPVILTTERRRPPSTLNESKCCYRFLTGTALD